MTLFDLGIFQGSFTSGATAAFLVGSADDARRLRGDLDLPQRQAHRACDGRAAKAVHVG